MRDDRERLEDILGAIQDIERYAARGREAFETDDLIQSWMVPHLMILGEAANGVSGPVRDASPPNFLVTDRRDAKHSRT